MGKIESGALTPNLKKLADKDLELDLLVRTPELPVIVDLAAQIPDLRIVLNHVAHVPIDGNPPDPEWVRGIEAIAQHSNTYMKVSALVEMSREQPAPKDPAYYVPTLDAIWNAFGEDRLVYGSNWPVCERAGEYSTVMQIVTEYFKAKGEEASEKYFWENAKAAYKWVER